MTLTPQHVNIVRSGCSRILRIVSLGMVLWYGFAASNTATWWLHYELISDYPRLYGWEFSHSLLDALLWAVPGALSTPISRWIIVFPDSQGSAEPCEWSHAAIRWALRAVAIGWTAWYLRQTPHEILNTLFGATYINRMGPTFWWLRPVVNSFQPIVLILLGFVFDARLARWAAPRTNAACPRCGYLPTPGGGDTCPECGLKGAFSNARHFKSID